MNPLNYWNPAGRLTRARWWRFQIWSMFGIIIVVFAAINIGQDNLRVALIAMAVAVFLLTAIILAIKRLHDRNKSGWWLAFFYGVPFLLNIGVYGVASDQPLYLVPGALIELWALIELGFMRGTRGPNRFGYDPISDSDLPPALPATRSADIA